MLLRNRLCILAICGMFLASCEADREKVKVQLSPLTESVYASLTVKPYNMYYAYSAVGGIVKSNLVSEGDLVTQGQVLVQIDNTNPELNAENARLALTLAKENYYGDQNILDELRNQIETARLQLKNDSINYFRQKRLNEKEIGSQTDLESRLLAYELSTNKLNLLKINYQQTKNELQTAIKQAENNYKTSQKTTKDYSISSEINGKVYDLMKERGEIVSQQEPLAMLGSSDSFLVEMLVDEVDIPRILDQQKVLIRLDAYGDEIFEGRVAKIYPMMDSRSQTFKIDGVFNDQPSKLYPGLTGEANIIVLEKKAVLSIPTEYLKEGDFIISDDGLVKVETGIKNFERVEILSGLDTTSFIYKTE